MSISHSFIPYPVQERIYNYYVEQEKSNENTKRHNVYESEDDSKTIRQEMSIKCALALPANRLLHNENINYNTQDTSTASPIRLYDAASTGNIILSNREKLLNLATNSYDEKKCFDGLCQVDEFYRNIFHLYPVNTSTKRIDAHIHENIAFNNAYWNGSAIYFGEVDHEIFTDLLNPDIIAHELGHAVTQFYSTSDLKYEGQSGALNESMSDVFAVIFKNHRNNPSGQNVDWTIGKNIVVMGDGSFASFRSMDHPGHAYQNHKVLNNDDQVCHMNDYKKERPSKGNDYGGVHKYSGIPNHAFYKAARSLQSEDWDPIRNIWFESLKQTKYEEDFQTFASRTLTNARTLYSGAHENEIGKAWMAVGVNPNPGYRERIVRKINRDYSANLIPTVTFVSGAVLFGAVLYNYYSAE